MSVKEELGRQNVKELPANNMFKTNYIILSNRPHQQSFASLTDSHDCYNTNTYYGSKSDFLLNVMIIPAMC